jgi:hypothetical protein
VKCTIKTNRALLAIAAAALIGGLAWLWSGVDGGPPVPATATENAARSAKIEVARSAAERQAIASAARDARDALRANHPATQPVLAKDMPAPGLPSTATHLPTQALPDQPMPTPRGSYPK